MNSTAKGDKFEEKVMADLERLVSNGKFLVPPSCCKFFRKKGYYSRDRCDDIVFDISIECFLPGETSYFLLILVECKDYGTPVPASDAEEFFQKMQQVRAGGAKGILASTNTFAKGAFEFCKSKGIGLLRYHNNSTLKWELNRSPSARSAATSNLNDIHAGFVDPLHRSRYFDVYCLSDNVYSYSLYTFLRNLLRSAIDNESLLVQSEEAADPHPPVVEYTSRSAIESKAEAVIKRVAYSDGIVSLENICTWQSEVTGLKVTRDAVPTRDEAIAQVLGRIIFSPLEITIFHHANEYRDRARFTLAHELGHHFLGHAKYMKGEYCQEDDFDPDKQDLGLEDIARMEWQANQFASSLLLPRKEFLADFGDLARKLDLVDRGHGHLYVDDQPCNQRNFGVVTTTLQRKYGVSRQAIELRLKRFGLLHDARGKCQKAFGSLVVKPRYRLHQ